jgi:hypothetical protein
LHRAALATALSRRKARERLEPGYCALCV